MAELADAADSKTNFAACMAVQDGASDSKHSKRNYACIALHNPAPTLKPTLE